MTQAARPWLPKEALADGSLAGLASGAAESWAERWFADDRHVSARLQLGSSVSSEIAAAAPRWQSEDGAILLALDPLRESTLAGWMLGLSTTLSKPASADKQLFANLAGACAQDLLRLLAQAFAASPRSRPTDARRIGADAVRFTISVATASQVIDLWVDRSRAVRARKDMMSRAPEKPPPRPRDEATARQGVRVGAFIGRTRIGLSELCSLDRGDILVLDRGLDDGVDLTVDDEVKAGVRCELRQDGDLLKLCMARLEESRGYA